MEGLPNITGTIKGNGLNDSITVSGAFYKTNTTNNKSDNSGYQSSMGIGFNAALYNQIYGSSAHVTPSNLSLKIWQRVS